MLGLGLKIPKLRTSGLAAWLRAFIKRVREDGGTVEGKACVKADGEFLINNTRAGIIIEALGDYSKAQGGDGLVNKTCSETAVNDLLFDPKPQTRFLFLSQDKNLELADYFCLNADVDALEGQFAVKGSVSNSYGSPTRGEVVLSLYNGTAPYTYKWSNGATTQNVANLAKGDYWVQATDANGNVANNKFTILGDADPSIVTAGLRMDSYFTDSALEFPALGSAEFNGTSDYIQLPDPFSYTKHTIASWVYLNNDSTNKSVFDNRDANDDGIVLIFLNTEELRYDINASASSYTNMPINEWTFITATYDGTSQKIFANGSEITSVSTSQTIETTGNSCIGRKAYASDEYFNGNLANVAIWNRALHPDEINALMWKSYGDLNAVDKNGLQAWYALDDINGTTVPDSTGTNNGTAN
jgi:phage tail protein X